MWYDYQMVEADRLTLAFALAASAHGACLANYVEAAAPRKDGSRMAGVQAHDLQSGDRFEIRAKITINAAGAHTGTFASQCGVKREYPLVKAMNVVTTKSAGEIALGAPTPSGRMLTLVPWHDRALIGTSQSHRLVAPGDQQVSDEELDAFLAEINAAFPALALRRDDVRVVHRGLVPAELRKGQPDLRRQTDVQDNSRDGVDCLISIVGVKYTTARAGAEHAVDLAQRKLGVRRTRSRTAATPLPGAEDADTETIARDVGRARGIRLEPPVIQHLAGIHGEGATALVGLIADDPSLAARIRDDDATIGADIVHAARHEMALTLVDALVRRTSLGAAGHPGALVADKCARLLQVELGWSDAHRQEEIAALDRFYLPVGPARIA
jgi:glycerol-3-phosphate dehydrogenase